MSITTRLTFHEFEQLPEKEGVQYELDEGELVMEPSPTYRHNRIRDRIARSLSEFVRTSGIGDVIIEMDFRLGPDTVRNPDVAYVALEHFRTIDLDRSPVDGAPALAVEVISPSNLAQDMLKKVGQYIDAGTKVVWMIYPSLRLAEIHTADGLRKIKEPNALADEKLFGKRFSIPLETLFTDNPAV